MGGGVGGYTSIFEWVFGKKESSTLRANCSVMYVRGRPLDVFMINFSYVEKNEKIQQMCEELKDRGTNAMKERGTDEICLKSQTLLWADACLRKLRHEPTKQKQALACVQNKKHAEILTEQTG